MRKTLLAMVLLAAGGLAQANVELNANHPESYRVVKGDTLWDISGKFLRQPWKWPEIWHANPQVRNPHLIYPGDVLSLVYIDGKPRIMVNRGTGGTVKLSPGIRKTPVAEAIPSIPLEAINSFLLNNRIVDSVAEFNDAPYVVAGEAERVMGGYGDWVYVRGNIESERSYDILRRGKDYRDPVTDEFLGINADFIASAKVVDRMDRDGTEEVNPLELQRTTQEVRVADRLFSTEERAIRSTFFPSEPPADTEGFVLDVPRGIAMVGKLDVVTINLGEQDGLQEGNVLAVHKTGETVRDQVTGERVKIPDERAGLLMVFRVYDRVSYGVVLQASRQLAVMDKVRAP